MVNVMTALVAGTGLQVTACVTVSSFHIYTISFSKAARGRPEGPTERSVFKFFLSCWLFYSQLLDIISHKRWGENCAAERLCEPGERGRKLCC